MAMARSRRSGPGRSATALVAVVSLVTVGGVGTVEPVGGKSPATVAAVADPKAAPGDATATAVSIDTPHRAPGEVCEVDEPPAWEPASEEDPVDDEPVEGYRRDLLLRTDDTVCVVPLGRP